MEYWYFAGDYVLEYGTASAPETIGSASSASEITDLFALQHRAQLDDELGYPVTDLDIEVSVILVAQENSNFTSIVRVNNPGHDVDTML